MPSALYTAGPLRGVSITLDDLARILYNNGVRRPIRGGRDEFDVPVWCERCGAELFMGVYVYRLHDDHKHRRFYACSDCLRKAGPLLEEMYASCWRPPSQSTSMPKAGPLPEEMYGRGGNGAA